MQDKFLKEVLGIVAGKSAVEIVNFLDGNKYVNEFIIAKKLDITINQTRNILYKISDHGLVSSIRKKDKKKGWYTYFWKIEVLKSLNFLKNILEKNLNQLNNQIKSREAKRFYVCERCNIEFSEENALLHDFSCDECGALFTLKDNTKVLRDYRRMSERWKKQLKLVEEEIQKEEEKFEKKKLRISKKEKKEKDKKKAKKKKATKKLVKKSTKKKIIKKKAGKKLVKKKKQVKKLKKKKPVKKVKKKSKKKIKKPAKEKKIIKKKIMKKKLKKKIHKKKISKKIRKRKK